MTKKKAIAEVIDILHKLDSQKREITSQTLILTELDLDSLKMMELLEILLDEYKVDFFVEPYSFRDLRTPETVAEALCRGLNDCQNMSI